MTFFTPHDDLGEVTAVGYVDMSGATVGTSAIGEARDELSVGSPDQCGLRPLGFMFARNTQSRRRPKAFERVMNW